MTTLSNFSKGNMLVLYRPRFFGHRLAETAANPFAFFKA